MFTVYAISSLNRNYVYVGLTSDFDTRFAMHNTGKNRTTKAYAPFKIIYKESVETRADARLREKYWKSGIGKERLKKIRNSLE